MLTKQAKKVQDILNERGFPCHVLELPETTRTASEAAQTIGCRVEQIVKSLVFRAGDKAILVLVSGANLVDEKKLGAYTGSLVEKADADFVREATGFGIGGVPPVGHSLVLDVFIDEDLLLYEDLWAAAGTPHAVFELSSKDLVKMTKGRVVSVK